MLVKGYVQKNNPHILIMVYQMWPQKVRPHQDLSGKEEASHLKGLASSKPVISEDLDCGSNDEATEGTWALRLWSMGSARPPSLLCAVVRGDCEGVVLKKDALRTWQEGLTGWEVRLRFTGAEETPKPHWSQSWYVREAMSLEIKEKVVWVDAAHCQNCSLNAIVLPFQGPISRRSVTLQQGILRSRTSFGHHTLNTPKQSVRNLCPWPRPKSVSNSC